MGKARKKCRFVNSQEKFLFLNKGENKQGYSKKIQPLLQKLQSVVANERQIGLGTISVMCEDRGMRETFMKNELVHLVMSRLLSDENIEIMVDAYGLLGNLCLQEGHDVAVELWRHEIWSNLDICFDKVLQSLAGLSEGPEVSMEPKRLLFEFCDNIITLVISLANGSEDIFSNIMELTRLDRVLAVVRDILKHSLLKVNENTATLKITTQLFNSVIYLIYTFASESTDFIEIIVKNEYLFTFLTALPSLKISNGNELTKVLIQGIMLQLWDARLSYDQATTIFQCSCTSIEKIDPNTLEVEIQPMVHTEMNMARDNEGIPEKVKDYMQKRSITIMQLQSLEIFLDIVTALTELMAAKYENGDMNVPEDLVKILSDTLPSVFLKLGKQFVSRVLISWNNLLWLLLTVKVNIFELPNGYWKSLWSYMREIDNNVPGNRIGKMRCLWALLKTIHLQESPGQLLQHLQCNSKEFTQSIIKEYSFVQDMDTEDVLELRRSCCGVLSILGLFQNQIPVNMEVGNFFLEILSDNSVPASLALDVLNYFIDIYSDGEFDYDFPVFVQSDYLRILNTQVVPNLKKRFKLVDKNKYPQLKAECHNVFTTLDSFIRYKQNERI